LVAPAHKKPGGCAAEKAVRLLHAQTGLPHPLLRSERRILPATTSISPFLPKPSKAA